MACLAFATALTESDNNALHSRLHKLIAAGDYSGDALPSIAQDYLRAFCNTQLSYLRRRWIGIALAGMMNASIEVVEHLRVVEQQLQALGNIILSNTEREETKVVAGFVMRQALLQHVDFSSFWTSDNVKNSALNFPKAADPNWMGKFQSFLDTLCDLALANPITDPFVGYPVSVVASDVFHWAAVDDGVPIAIIENELLTILMPDASMRAIQSLDVPVAHIQSTKTRHASLHDSQSRSTKHEACELVLMLNKSSWGYRLNASTCTGTELIILFKQSEDAKECELVIRELQNSCGKSVNYATASDVRLSSPPPQTSIISKQHQVTEAFIPNVRSHLQHVASRSSSIKTSRRRQPVRLHVEPEHSSTKDEDNEMQSRHLTPEPVPTQEENEPSDRTPNHQPKNKHQLTKQTQTQNGVVATQPTEHIRPVRELETTKMAQKPAQTQTVPTSKGTRKAQSETCTVKTRANKVRACAKSTQASNEQEDLPSCRTSASGSPSPEHAILDQTTCSTGKLPKASQALKQMASQEPRRQQDIFDIPNEHHKRSTTRKQSALETSSDAESNLSIKVKKSTVPTRAYSSIDSGRPTRSKQKAEDDDEFVPGKSKPVKKGTTKRKSVPNATTSNRRAKKNTKAEQNVNADGALVLNRSTPSKAKVQQSHHEEVTNQVQSQQGRLKGLGKPRPSSIASRTPLIGGLLGSQQPSPATQPTFKKPALPSRPLHLPSTPPRRQSLPTVSAARPHTPIGQQRPSKTSVPLISSSPPPYDFTDEDQAGPQNMDAEILSSNSKPVPASPHAESTAISGHADRDDVDLERRNGDVQTARLDPFSQRRREGQKATPFIRRLTGDDLVDDRPLPIKALSHANPFVIEASDSSDIEDLRAKYTSKLPSLPRVDVGERSSVTVGKAMVWQPLEVVHAEIVEVSHQEDKGRSTPISQSLKRKAIENVEDDGDCDGTRKKPTTVVTLHASPERSSAQKAVPVREVEIPTVELDSIYTAPQQAIDDTQTEHAVELQDDFDMNGNTLINNGSEEQLPTFKATPIHFRSSPPVPGTPSSHSSTSAESEPSPTPPLPPSDAEEMEWEASLQPHQRALHDSLMRVSKRVLRHVVDNESAVTDIADVFESDGEHLLQDVLQRQNAACDELWQDMHTKKKKLQKDLETSARALARERKRISALT
jgi:hypothetical protein